MRLLLQHNLGGDAMARDVPELCWSVAQGVHLSLDISGAAARANASWLAVVGSFQRELLSRFADYTGAPSRSTMEGGRTGGGYSPPLS